MEITKMNKQLSKSEIKVKFPNYEIVGDFVHLRACVRENGKWFHILPDGTPNYKEKYDYVENFSCGRAWVVGIDGKRFYIHYTGEPACGPYDETRTFHEDRASVRVGDMWFEIGRHGEVLK
jgi:hypothetical protein